jgi:homoserine dehydrogenase
VLVVASDADGTERAFLEALRSGCDVVTATRSRWPVRWRRFRELRQAAVAAGRLLKAEATVGAGLPVMDTLEMLLGTGDRLMRAEGCLSGTLGFLMARLEEGMPFSRAVAAAVELGYTEPDPVADLSGADVARKATILGRLAGLAEADEPVQPDSLVDPALAGLPLEELLDRLRAYDVPMAARVAAAKNEGKVVRYIATVAPGHIAVGPAAVPAESPAGAFRAPTT